MKHISNKRFNKKLKQQNQTRKNAKRKKTGGKRRSFRKRKRKYDIRYKTMKKLIKLLKRQRGGKTPRRKKGGRKRPRHGGGKKGKKAAARPGIIEKGHLQGNGLFHGSTAGPTAIKKAAEKQVAAIAEAVGEQVAASAVTAATLAEPSGDTRAKRHMNAFRLQNARAADNKGFRRSLGVMETNVSANNALEAELNNRAQYANHPPPVGPVYMPADDAATCGPGCEPDQNATCPPGCEQPGFKRRAAA